MYDPGNIYIIGFSMMFAFAAAILFCAKRSLDRQGNEKSISMKPVITLASVSAFLLGAMAAKIIFLADFYQTHSMYAPA